MDFSELIERRHSVRSYKPDPVEAEKLQKILEAAVLAPTAANIQPFKIFVVSTEGRKEVLGKIYGREWFSSAPFIICVCIYKDKCWVRRDGKSYGDVDAAIVMDHIILAATEQGLGTCWIGSFDTKAVKNFLELEDSLEPVAVTPLGYENEASYKKLRKPLDELVTYK